MCDCVASLQSVAFYATAHKKKGAARLQRLYKSSIQQKSVKYSKKYKNTAKN
jgi:hypothetical protein